MFKKILVTGASGFIGRHLCQELYNKADYYNCEIIALGTNGEDPPFCHKYIECEFDNFKEHLIPNNIDVCFHQAANNDTTDKNIYSMNNSNLHVPSNLFEFLVNKKECKKFIYASSCSVYGNQPTPYKENVTKLEPLNPYAESKLLFEQFANNFSNKYKVSTIGLRYSNVYGPGENSKGKRASMIYQLLQKMLLQESPKLFKYGEQRRDWVYIKDVVKANILSLQHKGSDIFNIGSGKDVSFNELVSHINKELDLDLKTEYTECGFEKAYQNHTLCDISKAKKYLKYTPDYDVLNGIKDLIEKSHD